MTNSPKNISNKADTPKIAALKYNGLVISDCKIHRTKISQKTNSKRGKKR
jgi:hypothetical protein